MKEGAAAEAAVQAASRRTTMRRELARHRRFAEVSPDVGELDERAFAEALAADGDETMALLAELTGATDERLRALARRLAARLVVEVARSGRMVGAGVGRLTTAPWNGSGDVDLDASLDALAVTAPPGTTSPGTASPGAGRSARRMVDPAGLLVREWKRPATALCLLVDRSGSMGGEPLATSAVAAAAIAARAPGDYSVVAFGADAVVVKSQDDAAKSAGHVATDVLALRGTGTTDVALALRTAGVQLARSRATRRVTVLLSDCRATVPGDVVGAARLLDELVIVAPADDADDAERLARQVGARLARVTGPLSLPAALDGVL